MINDTLLPQAEQELLTEAKKTVKELSKKKPVYKCTTDVVWCAGYRNGVFNEADEIDLNVGQRVTVVDAKGKEYTSRVREFDKQLDIKHECEYVVGENSIYSKMGELKDKIDSLGNETTDKNGGGPSIYVIKRYDRTAASDSNFFQKRSKIERHIRLTLSAALVRKK